MEYNSNRDKLIIGEYGRNIQKMIDYTITIEDRAKRTEVAKFIVEIMAQMNPQLRDFGDIRHKLWDHLFIISNFKLDVDGPYPPPSPQIISRRPKKIAYSNGDIKFRHYGKHIQEIIDKAIEYEDGAEKDALVRTIANHMKKSYLTWNRESVNDELITDHLSLLSKNLLKLSEDTKLHHTNEILARNKKKKFKTNSPSNHRIKKDKKQ